MTLALELSVLIISTAFLTPPTTSPKVSSVPTKSCSLSSLIFLTPFAAFCSFTLQGDFQCLRHLDFHPLADLSLVEISPLFCASQLY